MTLDANPEYMYGTRGRKRGLPHEQFVYADVREGMGRGFTARQICDEYRGRLGMNLKQVERVMETLRANDYAGPRLHGVGRGGDKIGDEQMEFLLRWLEDTGARKTSETMCQMLRIRFRINVTGSGMRRALERYRISYKKLTQMDKRAFTPAVRELTRVFLLRRLGLDKRDGVWVDEFLYKPENVGSKYGYASSYLRAIQVDDGRGSGDGVMFIAAMTDTEVLPITLPVVQPATVTGWLFEMWCVVFLLPAMLVRGKRFVAMDNARVHRKRVLRALFWAVGIFVIFLPPYSPWFMPIEKVFLSTHMKCNRRVRDVRANFIPRVLEVLHGHTPNECAGCVRHTGWV